MSTWINVNTEMPPLHVRSSCDMETDVVEVMLDDGRKTTAWFNTLVDEVNPGWENMKEEFYGDGKPKVLKWRPIGKK